MVLVDRGYRKEVPLTASGLEICEASTRKLRPIQTRPVRGLKLSTTVAHEAVTGREASLDDLLLSRLFKALGEPDASPQGNRMPG